mmetsp:Transcript_6014/g.14911  ORF Transcript_6014/g.14911 Transcript_6014/m.14911 type:complete len:213 (-) Transcript_6014:401-1039(-)
MFRKNLMARDMTVVFCETHAEARIATARSSFHTCLRYNSHTRSVPRFAATSVADSFPLPVPSDCPWIVTTLWRYVWMERLTLSSRLPFLLMLRISWTMCRYRSSRRPLSGTTAISRKNNSNRCKGFNAPLFLIKISADTHAFRTSRWSCNAADGIVIWNDVGLLGLFDFASFDTVSILSNDPSFPSSSSSSVLPPTNNPTSMLAIRSDSRPL